MPPPLRPRASKFIAYRVKITTAKRGIHGCGYRSYQVNLSIVIRPSITSDPKTIAKHAGVRKNGASNTAEGVRILLLRVRRHKITNCERGVNGCGYRSYRVKWGIEIRFSITPDPKTIVKQAGVSKYAASNTAEGAQIYFHVIRSLL